MFPLVDVVKVKFTVTACCPSSWYVNVADAFGVITIPSTSQVNADWNAVSGVAQILNKPTIYGTGTETWTFTLSDNTTVTKTIVVG